ncbi:hypothetical protein ACOYXV_04235 [Aeromonas veronii]
MRELQPERVVLVDAAEIGEKAGTLQVIPPRPSPRCLSSRPTICRSIS